MCAAVYRCIARHLVKATKVNAGLAESSGRLLLGIWRDSLHVTCGLTACTLGSAPGPTLGNEYGKTLPFTSLVFLHYLVKLETRNLHLFTSMLCVALLTKTQNMSKLSPGHRQTILHS